MGMWRGAGRRRVVEVQDDVDGAARGLRRWMRRRAR
jgi:hypothetical protein